jgi:hypothetical protein
MRKVSLIGMAALAGIMQGNAWATDVVTNPFYGVTEIQRTLTVPRPLNISNLQIDLNAPGISFKITPPDANPPTVNGVPDETITETTRDYVTGQGAQLGINTSFFRLQNSGQALWTNNTGLAASDGAGYSPWDNSNQVAINLSSNNAANVVTPAASRPTGYEISQSGITLYNAFTGSNQVLTNGVVTAPSRTSDGGFDDLNPRTGAGITKDNRLLLVTIDGRQSGFSEGMYLDEVGTLLLSLGANDGLNLDGGGSTTMVVDKYNDGTGPQVVNSSVGRGGVGTERYVGQSLAGFAQAPAPAPVPAPAGVQMLDEFETGFGHFAASPTFSGSNRGVSASTKAEMVQGAAERGQWSEKLSIVADQDATPGYLLRFLSGIGSPSNNIQMGTTGYVGFFLKTTNAGLHASIGIDENLANTTANEEQGAFLDIIPDGQWHLYEWNLADASMWDSFAGGNGQIDGPITTIDCIFIKGDTNVNSTVSFDSLAYNPTGSLAVLVPEPTSAALMFGIALMHSRRRRLRKTIA